MKKAYYQYNNHGDVISVLDQAGAIKNEYDYDAFGNAITEKETVSNPYRYAGYYQDSESGLYYLQSRYYNPRTARFLTEDTASGKYTDPLSLNKYTYCHNQPVTGYDPDGHFLHIVAGAAIGALVSGGISYVSQAVKNKSFTKVNWRKVAGSAAEGAITGGVGAATGGASLAASAAGTAAKTGAKTVAKTTAKAVAKNVAKKVAANVAGNAAGNIANQAISKGVKKISAKEAAVAGATGILDVAGDAAGAALKKVGSKAVRKIAGAVGERAGAAAAKKAGAKAAQKTLASSAAAGVVGAGADAIPEGKIAGAVGGENVYDLMKRKGIPSTLSDEEIAAARAVDLRMQAGKKNRYKVSDTRRKHILEGEGPTDEGHGPNRGFTLGAFPDTWNDDQVISAIEDVANNSASTWKQATGQGANIAPVTIGGPDLNAPEMTRKGTPVRFKIKGRNHGLNITVIAEPHGEGIITGYNNGR